MIAEIASEIRTHFFSFSGERISLQTSQRFEGKPLTVTFLQFRSETGLIIVIALELSDDKGHSASQDLLMEKAEEFESKLMGNNFNDDLVKCLGVLNEALKEMN